MLNDLKQKILSKFPKDQEHQICHLYDLIQAHINNSGLEGEEIAGIIINYLHNTNFLEFHSNLFDANKFIINGNK